MSARATMTMRATIERDLSSTTTDWGRDGPPSFVEVANGVPCRAYSKMRKDVDDDGKDATVEDMRCLVTAAADVQEEDQITIVDRLGVLQFGGPVLVDTRSRRGGAGSRPMHYELGLRRHTTSA